MNLGRLLKNKLLKIEDELKEERVTNYEVS